MSPRQQVKLSSCQAHFQFYQVVNFINCHLVKSEKTLYILCLGVAIAMGLKTIQSYLIARALSAGLQFAKPNSLSEWNSMIPRISIKSTKQSAHQMRKRAIGIILKMTSGFPTPAKIRFRHCPFSEKNPFPWQEFSNDLGLQMDDVSCATMVLRIAQAAADIIPITQ